MDLTDVKEALERIAGSAENEASIQGPPQKGEKTRQYFCIEDTLRSKDIDVTVDGIGKLSFPLSEEIIKNMINVSSKAKFGRGEDTVLDTSVRDTQVISAKHLEVKINNDSLSDILEKMCSGLNLGRNASLAPHLYNLLIYGPGQFFKMHRDSEKMKNMVATLVILLPSDHKGGELIIEHNNQKHVFLRSKFPEIVKCVMFYSDCQHEIKEITEGYRIALTYNVVLEEKHLNANEIPIDEELDNALLEYFDSDEEPEKFVYFFNHSYSEHSLKWGLLKGADRTCAMALLAVAKHQGRIPCLALADHTESYNVEGRCYGRYYNDSGSETELLDSSTNLYFWVNENSLPIKEEKTDVSEDEMCCTVETKDLFEPYKTEESGPTGNEGETRDHWYRRACVVLWVNKWSCSAGFKDAIIDLHSLTTSEGNEAKIQNEIDIAGSKFYQTQLWHTADVCDFMIDIVMYLNDGEKATTILSKVSSTLLKCDNIDKFLELERQFDQNTWMKIVNAWKNVLNWISTSKFIAVYIKRVDISKSKVVGPLLEACLDCFKKTQGNTDGSDVLIDIVCVVVKYINDNKKSISILSKLSPKLLKCDKVDSFLELERKFDNDTWVKIFNAWEKTYIFWKITLKFIEAYTKQADLSKSKVIALLLESCVDGFIKSTKSYKCDVPPSVYSSNINSSMNSRYIYDRTTNKETINHLCQLFYLCLKANSKLLENQLAQHVISTPTVFSSKGLAEIFLRLKGDLPNDCARYNILYDTALLKVHQDLTEVINHGESWYWPIDIPCRCEFCVEVKSFFHSKSKKVVIPASAPNRKHVYSFLNPLRNHPVTFDTERRGSPYKIVIEKSEKLIKDRQSLIAELSDIEKKLLACGKFVDNNYTSKDHLATTSTIDKNPCEEHPIPTKRMKM